MKVRLTSEAQRNLHEIGEWIAAQDPDAAYRLVDRLRLKALGLGELPYGYPVVLERCGSMLRKCSYRSYVIIYHVTAQVEVILICHASRDYLSLLETR